MLHPRVFAAAAVTLCLSLPGTRLAATADPGPSPQVSVREARGLYSVSAQFDIPQSVAATLAVLSDYEQIPRFMPEVRTSVVRERTEKHVMVEQEAVSRLMMFSRKVHLVLEVTKEDGTIRFIDRCGESFTSYQGTWQVMAVDGRTMVSYELTAAPAFDVPGFVLKRLLKRDSVQMIERLRREIATRAGR